MSTTVEPHTSTSSDPTAGVLHRLVDEKLARLAQDARKAAAGAELHLATSARALGRALWRVQAIVSVVRDSLSKRERRAVRQGLRHVRDGLAPLDRELAAVSQVSLDDAERAIATAVIETAVAPSRDELLRLVTDAATQLAEHIETVRARLPEGLEWSEVIAGAKDLYREARRARRDAKRSKRAFLRWARRTEQLVDVLALAEQAGEKVDLAALIAAIEIQHPVLELIELRAFVRDHEEHVEHYRLLAALDARIEPAIADARRAAKDAFARRPRQFARDLATRPQAAD